jgi:hypothetical protein
MKGYSSPHLRFPGAVLDVLSRMQNCPSQGGRIEIAFMGTSILFDVGSINFSRRNDCKPTADKTSPGQATQVLVSLRF